MLSSLCLGTTVTSSISARNATSEGTRPGGKGSAMGIGLTDFALRLSRPLRAREEGRVAGGAQYKNRQLKLPNNNPISPESILFRIASSFLARVFASLMETRLDRVWWGILALWLASTSANATGRGVACGLRL